MKKVRVGGDGDGELVGGMVMVNSWAAGWQSTGLDWTGLGWAGRNGYFIAAHYTVKVVSIPVTLS